MGRAVKVAVSKSAMDHIFFPNDSADGFVNVHDQEGGNFYNFDYDPRTWPNRQIVEDGSWKRENGMYTTWVIMPANPLDQLSNQRLGQAATEDTYRAGQQILDYEGDMNEIYQQNQGAMEYINDWGLGE
jgi:hypothetical protein